MRFLHCKTHASPIDLALGAGIEGAADGFHVLTSWPTNRKAGSPAMLMMMKIHTVAAQVLIGETDPEQ